MPNSNRFASRIFLTIDGAQVARAVMQKVLEVTVDQHVHLPDMFSIRLNDPGLELLDGGPFDLTRKVKIEAAREDGERAALIEGEITSLEPDFAEGMLASQSVRGYDVSHRLFREMKSRAHQNKKDSDLAEEIARDASLQSEVEATSIVYEHIYQHNQSDLDFLMQRAWRIGFECFVSGGKLMFRKPPANDRGLTLTWGRDLLSFQPRMSLAEQVDEVVVRGWDVDRQAAIVGRAQKGNLYPTIEEPKNGAEWAKTFGKGKLTVVDRPVASQAEADQLAAARLDEISGAFIDAEGIAYRRPDIRAGRIVKLQALGNRFSGDYLLTRATHVYSAEGLKTTFHVRGSRTGLLVEEIAPHLHLDRWPGVVTAIVTNAEDPKGWGRVKLKFPWMSDDAESSWARVALPGAGPQAGLAAIPAVGDEVVVAFEHGDFGQPFVLGGLWNGKHQLPPEAAGAESGEKPLVRVWRSRSGHCVMMRDDNENKIEIKTKAGHTITLDDKKEEIVITGPKDHNITMNKDITIESKANLALIADLDLILEAKKSMTIKATQLNLEGSAETVIKGGMVRIN